jgi:hypothetical protein
LQTSIRNGVVAFAAGAIVGLAIRSVADRDPSPGSARVSVDDDLHVVSAPPPPASASAPIERGIPVTPAAPVATTGATSASGPAGTATATERMAAQQPPIPRAVLSDDFKARPAPLDGLLNASSLRCDIEVAHGANWSQGRPTLHGISYQGGPFSFESIDLHAETAMMSGGSGVTGSLSGELEMRTTAGNKGLTFSAFTRHGDLLIVTVYPALDSNGRYRTVMTTFGDQYDHETAQFFGACDITLMQR